MRCTQLVVHGDTSSATGCDVLFYLPWSDCEVFMLQRYDDVSSTLIRLSGRFHCLLLRQQQLILIHIFACYHSCLRELISTIHRRQRQRFNMSFFLFGLIRQYYILPFAGFCDDVGAHGPVYR